MKTKIRKFWYEFRLRIEAALVAMLPVFLMVGVVAASAGMGYLSRKEHARYLASKREKEVLIDTLEKEKAELISELTAYRVMAEWKKSDEERRGQ